MGKVRTEKRNNKAALIKEHGEEKALAILKEAKVARRRNILRKAVTLGRVIKRDKDGIEIASCDRLSKNAQNFLMTH